MEFFNRKEEVLDVELTQYGKYLLSIGMFKPAMYAFFDDDVVYDIQYQGNPPNDADANPSTENQKETEKRIKETPRVKVQHSFKTVDKTSNQIDDNVNPGNVTIPQMLQIAAAAGTDQATYYELVNEHNLPLDSPYMASEDGQTHSFPYPIDIKAMTYGNALPLGTSEYNSSYYPSWSANMLRGKILDSMYYDSGSFGVKRIPQIEIETTYRTSYELMETAKSTNPLSIPFSVKPLSTIGPNGPPGDPGLSRVTQNGTYVKVEQDYILIDLQELNAYLGGDYFGGGDGRFELEVFEIINLEQENEHLRQLSFQSFPLGNGPMQLYGQEISNVIKRPNESNVEYYFDVRLDSEVEVVVDNRFMFASNFANVMEPCLDDE